MSTTSERSQQLQGITPVETHPERLWREFLEARERSLRSGALSDGIAAGRAYGAFLQEFAPSSSDSATSQTSSHFGRGA
jgi:hypothetical protein